MKKTCNNCKALEDSVSSVYCSLGYKVKPVTFMSVVVRGEPLEDCPKPTTVKRYHDLMMKKFTDKGVKQ